MVAEDRLGVEEVAIQEEELEDRRDHLVMALRVRSLPVTARQELWSKFLRGTLS